MKRCDSCGSEFEPRSNRQKFCSLACRRGTSTCQRCGTEFVRKAHTAGRYCSRSCSDLGLGLGTTTLNKTCSKCEQDKYVDDFPLSGGHGARSSWCRACHHIYYVSVRDKQRSEVLTGAFADFAERVRRERKQHALTQVALGNLVGVSNSQVAVWERGVSLPRQRTLLKLCEIFGWTLPYEVRPDKNWRIPLSIDKCESCGNEFPVYKRGVRHCSRACSGKTLGARQTGPANHSWNGGRISTAGGYVKVKTPGHPKADAGGYVLEHRRVMEQQIGRQLLPHERVHHKNGKRDDNAPSNLELWRIKGKDPAGVRSSDYHCPGCRCVE